MKKVFFAAALLSMSTMLWTGCSSDDVVAETPAGPSDGNAIAIKDAVIHVDYPGEGMNSRAGVTPEGKLSWLAGDKVTAFVRLHGESVADWTAGHKHVFVVDGQNPDSGNFHHDPNCPCMNADKQLTLVPGQAYDWYLCHDCDGDSPESVMPSMPVQLDITPKQERPANDIPLSMYGAVENSVCQANGQVVGAISLKHLYTMMSFNLKNRMGAGCQLKKLTFEAPATAVLAAPASLNLMNGTWTAAEPAKTANQFDILFKNDGQEFLYGDTYNVYFTCLPFDLNPGEEFKIHATYRSTQGTDETFVVTKKMSSDKHFQSGKINRTSAFVGSAEPSNKEKVEIYNEPLQEMLLTGNAGSKIDTDGDGVITHGEALNVTRLTINPCAAPSRAANGELKTLDGIENFPNLRILQVEGQPDNPGTLTSLDVSKNTNLEALHCPINQIDSITFGNNTKLQFLYCFDNKLRTLDLHALTALRELNCCLNQLQKLDVSRNRDLKSLNLFINQVTSLDLTQNNLLEYLDATENKLQVVSFGENTKLSTVRLASNEFTSLDVSKLRNLQNLSLRFAPEYKGISSLDVTKNTGLKVLEMWGLNNLTSLDLSQNAQLAKLRCDKGTAIQTLDLRKNLNLVQLWLQDSRVGKVLLPKLDKLNILSLANSATVLEPMDFSLFPNLTELHCERANKLGSYVDISGNTKLQHFNVFNTIVKQIVVWNEFDINNPPLNFMKDADAEYVHAGVLPPNYDDNGEF